jgi:hypothetical protein
MIRDPSDSLASLIDTAVISPKKPANASALQPNQKRYVTPILQRRARPADRDWGRRKVVEDEFAGSDDDD